MRNLVFVVLLLSSAETVHAQIEDSTNFEVGCCPPNCFKVQSFSKSLPLIKNRRWSGRIFVGVRFDTLKNECAYRELFLVLVKPKFKGGKPLRVRNYQKLPSELKAGVDEIKNRVKRLRLVRQFYTDCVIGFDWTFSFQLK